MIWAVHGHAIPGRYLDDLHLRLRLLHVLPYVVGSSAVIRGEAKFMVPGDRNVRLTSDLLKSLFCLLISGRENKWTSTHLRVSTTCGCRSNSIFWGLWRCGKRCESGFRCVRRRHTPIEAAMR